MPRTFRPRQGQTTVQVEQVPVRDLSQLPMDGGWTYGELLGKAAAGDFRANMLAGSTGWGFIT